MTQAMRDSITPLIITYNEAPNIGRVMDKLAWAKRIVVLDSGSSDDTLAIVRRWPQAEIHTRSFDSFAGQCNHGLSLIGSGWVLSLDADYVLSDRLVAEIAALEPPEAVAGYRASFIYCVHGRNLRGTLYPPRTVLYRAGHARYHDVGHGHRVTVEGEVKSLAAPIFHDDRKPLGRWLQSQQSYARTEAAHLLSSPPEALSRNDRLRLMAWPAPVLVLLYTLFVKGAVLDGWPGWFYALQRLLAETVLTLEIIDRRAAPRQPSETSSNP